MPNSKQEHIILGFDFGMKSIGVAIGQNITQSANPLDAIPAKDGIPKWESIEALIKEWQPTALVVGVPLNMDGSDQTITHAARKFANRLHTRFDLPVHSVDERLTTVEAKAELFETEGYASLKKEKIDSMSAKLIVEQWLNLHRS